MVNINVYWLIGGTVALLLGGLILAFTVSFWYAFPLLLIGIILLIVYFLFGSVNSAARQIQNGDFAKADKMLNLTLKPAWLYVTQRAIYYILKGSIAMNNKDTSTAESYFDQALGLKLPTDNERAMVLLQMANINASKGKWNTAKNYFREIKKLKVTEGTIKSQIDQFDKALQQSGQANIMRGGSPGANQMMQLGSKSKRRRPRM